MDFEELKRPVTITWGFLFAIVAATFVLGGLVVKVLDTREYAEQEIDGLRSDWDRHRKEDNAHFEKELEILRNRIDKENE